jgi:hypothetical protein
MRRSLLMILVLLFAIVVRSLASALSTFEASGK